MKSIGLILLTTFLTSCATTYQKNSFSGGYSDMRINKDMYKVTFRGNGYTNSDVVHNFLLRRCAEVTLENGYNYFVFVNQNAQSTKYHLGTNHNGTLQKNYSGSYQYSGTTQNFVAIKHSRVGIIKLFNNGEQPEVAYSAKEILKSFK